MDWAIDDENDMIDTHWLLSPIGSAVGGSKAACMGHGQGVYHALHSKIA